MKEYSVEEIELKIKDIERKFQNAEIKGADRNVTSFLKQEIKSLKDLREKLLKISTDKN